MSKATLLQDDCLELMNRMAAAVMAGRKETIHTTPWTGIRWTCCNTWSRPTRTQERQS